MLKLHRLDLLTEPTKSYPQQIEAVVFEHIGCGLRIFYWTQVEGEPQGVCVSRGNVYITCSGSRLIKVYTGDGQKCLRSVKLQQDVSSPWHAIPLPDSDRFIVSHGLEGGKLHRVCLVDANGKVRPTIINPPALQ